MKGLLGLFVFACITPVLAHLVDGSLRPEGGETFYVGETVEISWVTEQAHDGRYDIYWSTNGGNSWPDEVGPWNGSTVNGDTNFYYWEISEGDIGDNHKVRICQLFGGHCTEPGTYTLVSPESFAIEEAPAGIDNPQARGINSLPLDLKMENGVLNMSFELKKASNISLKIFDVNGTLQGRAAEGQFSAGSHQVTYTKKEGFTGPLFIKLVADQRLVASKVWNNLP